jgi:REP element-mobilizing transposase RayT
MTRARREVVSLDDTPYYHCISRCVRRAFLCGIDRLSRKDYSHRKAWIQERLAFLSGVFSVRICAYAVMSNHYHLVLKVEAGAAQEWSNEEVIGRWGELFGVPELVRGYHAGTLEGEALRQEAERWIEDIRARLHDVSWFMRCLNEWLARKANAEDGCKGRFWEGRFKSQALLDEAALLTCMSYVDLNPIRAGVARTPEEASDTSVSQRVQALRQSATASSDASSLPLVPCDPRSPSAIPFSLRDYLELVDWTGRAIREDKRGAISESLPPILARLNIDPDRWRRHMQRTGLPFYHAIGRPHRLRELADSLGRSWLCGLRACEQLFRPIQVIR